MTHSKFVWALMLAASATAAGGQSPATFDVATPAQQIALAVLPAPESMRGTATVLGYRANGELKKLRLGSNGVICLADDPREPGFHPACYHSSLEPFMARGREIRARYGNKRGVVDSLRLADVRAGRLRMPTRAVLYQIYAETDSVDVATATVKSPTFLHVVYIPYATPATTGLTTDALRGTPWLMSPGKPWAHIMIVP